MRHDEFLFYFGSGFTFVWLADLGDWIGVASEIRRAENRFLGYGKVMVTCNLSIASMYYICNSNVTTLSTKGGFRCGWMGRLLINMMMVALLIEERVGFTMGMRDAMLRD